MVRTSVQFPLPTRNTTMMAMAMPVMEDQLHEIPVYRLGRERSTCRWASPLPETDERMTSPLFSPGGEAKCVRKAG